jgi:enamine deaminase RidA (YjgF/YER057c/UK114 family)
VNGLLFVSGHGPGIGKDGKPAFVGRVGAEVPLDVARGAAQRCALNCLASIKLAIGSLDRVCGVVQLRVFVNSSDDFHDQPKVADGASELLILLFGDAGGHARAALGTSNLPGNIPVEVEMIVQVVSEPMNGVKEGA